jgi:CarD family transcriptional regulator
MFSLNEKVVYPGHGVAQVNRIVEKNIGGCSTKFFELTVVSTHMTVLIPIDNLPETGIRRISTTEHIEDMFKYLETPADKKPDIVIANWSKKNKAYQCALRTGDLEEVCRIYRELILIKSQKELSFGEKNLLQKTENLLVEEISIATQITEDCARNRLRTSTRHSCPSIGLI